MKINMCRHGWARSACPECSNDFSKGETMSALDKQVGGSHYKDLAIQPVEFIHKNKIPFIEGCVIKYVSRWRDKGGVADLEKAKHFLELLIEMEQSNA
jgi:hypothetical protein